VADLDRRLEAQGAAAVRARVALAGLAQVGEPRRVVAAGFDAAQVEAVAVRPGHVLPLAERLVGHHLAGEADGPERAAARAEGLPDLLVGRRPRGGRERVEELRL